MHKLFEHYIWRKLLKFYDKMDLSIPMKIIYNVKQCYVIRFKFGDKFLTVLTKLELEEKVNICSTIKENLLLHCRNSTSFYNKVCLTKKRCLR